MKKRFLRIAAAGLAMALLTACGAQSKETEENLLHVGFLKAGKADAIVLWQGTEALLIDTGEDEDGEKLLSYMKSWGIKTVSAMIITHFDKDHVGGADHILESMGAERILQPDYEGDGKQYRQYVEALPDEAALAAVTETMEFSFGGAKVTVYPSKLTPEEVLAGGEKEYDNDLSLIVSVTHGNNRFLFAADAKEQRIREMLDSGEDWEHTLLKVPHHGRFGGETEHLLDALRPQYAVICCSEKNPADEETLKLLEEREIEVYLTMNGTVEAYSDGQELKLMQ